MSEMPIYKKCIGLNVKYDIQTFEQLQSIVYKDIFVNETGVRVLGIHYMDIDENWSVKTHSHSFFEFHYVLKNEVYTTLNNKEYKIAERQYYLMPPGMMHSHRQKDGRGHIGFALRWELLKSIHNETCNWFQTLYNTKTYPIKDNGNIISDMLKLLELAKEHCGILELQLKFLELLIHLTYSCTYNKNTNSDIKINSEYIDNQTVQSVIKFIKENYKQDIDVKDIANSVYLSYSHLARLFKKHIGSTVNQYLNQIRLDNAQYLLKCSLKDIRTIAREVGFNNEYYFSSVFKKVYGISPGNYRKNGEQLFE